MRKTTTFALAAILFAGPSLAGPCDHAAQAIAQRTKATIEAVTPEFGNVKFAHSAAHEMTLFCNPRSPSLFVAYDGKPDARFLALASVAGGVLLSAPVGVRAIADCLGAAAVDPSGEAQRDSGPAHIECAADVPNESGYVTIDRPE
jgi:hypothetical protein